MVNPIAGRSNNYNPFARLTPEKIEENKNKIETSGYNLDSLKTGTETD